MRNGTGDLSLCGMMSNQLSHTGEGTQSILNTAPFLKLSGHIIPLLKILQRLPIFSQSKSQSPYKGPVTSIFFTFLAIPFSSIPQIMKDTHLKVFVLVVFSAGMFFYKHLIRYYLLNKAFPNHHSKIIQPSDIPKDSLFPAFFPIILTTC